MSYTDYMIWKLIVLMVGAFLWGLIFGWKR